MISTIYDRSTLPIVAEHNDDSILQTSGPIHLKKLLPACLMLLRSSSKGVLTFERKALTFRRKKPVLGGIPGECESQNGVNARGYQMRTQQC